MIVSEYGTELTSNAVLVWYGVIGVEWHYIAPRQSGSYRFVGWISIDKRFWEVGTADESHSRV
jgi:hypothetical protein